MAIVSNNPILDRLFYDQAAVEYYNSLPLEHFMESTPQATQRKITLESFDLIHAARPDIRCYNELLIQYPVSTIHDIARVVPDNLVVVHSQPIRGTKSFNTPFEDARPFLVLEYVSEENQHKDYVENMGRYEKHLKVPYYLLFEPEKQQLLVHKLSTAKKKYVSVKPNAQDRLEIPELELEVGMLDEWVRYWFRGKLLPLPAELASELEETKRQLRKSQRQTRVAEEQAQAERTARQALEAELERMRAELKQFKDGNGV
ncbi:MAG TPA: Uma2 family endonuclease [Fimbriiglobus sp.]|nr:Uma2 family endonuclease [Fimbriiglobus sp.]